MSRKTQTKSPNDLFRICSLSHAISTAAVGYREIRNVHKAVMPAKVVANGNVFVTLWPFSGDFRFSE